MRIAVVNARRLAGLLCAVPALRALRAARPDANVTLIGLPGAAAFAARFHRYVDAFVEFPGFPGLPEPEWAPSALPVFYREMRARRYDLAVQMHDSGRLMNPLTALMGAQCTAGFYEAGCYCPDPASYLRWRADEAEALRWLRLLQHVGIPPRGTQLEFPLGEADRREMQRLRLAEAAYAVLHLASRPDALRWPAERYAELGDALEMEGLRVVLTGTRADAPLARAVRAAMREPAVDLSGRTSIGGFAAVLAGARLVVSEDEAVAPVAVAVGAPLERVAPGVEVEEVLAAARRLTRHAA